VPQYLIERNIPGISEVGYEQYKQIAKKSNGVLDGMQKEGTDVVWQQSYVAGDKIYCIYQAPNEEAVREHAKRGSFPANLIVPIVEVMTPKTGE
jgi:hypothetical protein